MHVPGHSSKKVTFMRPRTAATTTRYDESRIKNKLAALERLEHQITNNIESVANEIDLLTIVRDAKNFADREGKDQGIRLTKELVLENSMCDELRQIRTLMLRDKKIRNFDDDKKKGFDFDDMCNIECLFASHNQI